MKLFVLSTPAARQNCRAYLSNCPDGLAVEIKEAKAKRSDQANRRHWAIMNQISEEAWLEGRQYSAQVWHDFMCRRFIGTIDLPGGLTMAESSSKLNTAEFALFDERIEAYMGTDLGLTPCEAIEPMGRVKA